MTVPTSPTYSAAAIIAAHTALLALLDAAATPATLKLRDSADSLLATITMSDPAGTVNGTTGRLTLSIPAGTGDTGGTVAYGELCDGDGTVVVALPAASGSTATSGRIVMNSLTVFADQPITNLGATIG
jgi:hypothetical protein